MAKIKQKSVKLISLEHDCLTVPNYFFKGNFYELSRNYVLDLGMGQGQLLVHPYVERKVAYLSATNFGNAVVLPVSLNVDLFTNNAGVCSILATQLLNNNGSPHISLAHLYGNSANHQVNELVDTLKGKEMRPIGIVLFEGYWQDLKPSRDKLREYLLKYKIALQPNKHISTWHRISKTISENWGSISKLLEFVDYDFLKLRNIIQKQFKKDFPYLSGPKIFNYWSFIIQKYGNIKLKSSEFIEIAPDTHIIKCSVILGVINEDESASLSREEISKRWRNILGGSGINPIDMHPPLWFGSRNNFQFKLDSV